MKWWQYTIISTGCYALQSTVFYIAHVSVPVWAQTFIATLWLALGMWTVNKDITWR